MNDAYNTELAAVSNSDNRKGSPATIEDPARIENLRWQTRPAPLTADENALADALQSIFTAEVYELNGIVDRLNQMRISPPSGTPLWTEENFRAEIRRLANVGIWEETHVRRA